MKERKLCNPTIVDKNILMTDSYEFMPKREIKETCYCINKEICLQIADLLDNNKTTEALSLMDWLCLKKDKPLSEGETNK